MSQIHNYQLIVGNIGQVYDGTNGAQALREYGQWKKKSIANDGRSAGEPVTLIRDGEPLREYFPKEEKPAKLTFDEALERIADERSISANEVQARALRRYVWVAEWHVPGCLSESFSVCLTKSDALETALHMCGAARGAKSDLMRYGRTDRVSSDAYVSMAVTTIERRQLRTLF
jgi:hypothetical protein